jgi:AAA15 family ATPase/GTPase
VDKSLIIDGYRGFDHYEMHGLGRVNLLVGENNSGKTSILEAIALAVSLGLDEHFEPSPEILNSILNYRGEYSILVASKKPELKYDYKSLFYNSLSTKKQASVLFDAIHKIHLYATTIDSQNYTFHWLNETKPFDNVLYPVTDYSETEPFDGLQLLRPSRFFFSTSLTPNYVFTALSNLQLTNEEEHILEAIRCINPEIDRIAPQLSGEVPSVSNGSVYSFSKGNIIAKRKGDPRIYPIGRFGDGMWRMLGIILGLVQAKDSFFIIDDIDTGLHYTVMVKMWKMLFETAKKLNVHVFATTHSRDCIEALAEICRDDVDEDSEITIQRIDRSKKDAVRYGESNIVSAHKHGIEVR